MVKKSPEAPAALLRPGFSVWNRKVLRLSFAIFASENYRSALSVDSTETLLRQTLEAGPRLLPNAAVVPGVAASPEISESCGRGHCCDASTENVLSGDAQKQRADFQKSAR